MNENKWINMAHFVLRNYINLNTKKKEEKNTSEAIVRNLGT